jgi:hypothetical protein
MRAPDPEPAAALRIAMWSGPRNVSTALMRAFEARDDCAVCDEPLYAHYLAVTKLPHPGAEAVIASQPTDWREVARALTGPAPGGERVFYQKHMAHHLLPEVGRGWVWELANAFLIRDPREMLPSLDAVFPDPGLEDTGLPQQVELFEELRRRTGEVPPVVDSRDLLREPKGVLRALCARLGLDFQESMLSWPPGRRETDGVWAEHWYAGVERSTGFAPWKPKEAPFPARLEPLLARCEEPYRQLHAHRITP